MSLNDVMGLILTGLLVAMFLAVYEANRITVSRKRKRQWWEAPPGPLDNADRLENYHRRRYRM